MTRDTVVHDLSAEVRRLTLTTQQLRVRVATGLGIGVTELVALGYLTEAGQLTPKDLALLLDLSTGTVTAVADHLVDAGFARRAPNPADRRSILLSPTSSGVRARRGADQDFEELVGAGVSTLAAPLVSDVARALDTISSRIDATLTSRAARE